MRRWSLHSASVAWTAGGVCIGRPSGPSYRTAAPGPHSATRQRGIVAQPSTTRSASTVLLATHDYAVAARCERIVTLRDGRIASDRTLGAPAEPRTTAERLGALRPFTD